MPEAAETQSMSKKRLTEQDASRFCLSSDKHGPNSSTGFFASVWAYGSQFTNAHYRSDEKIKIETKKAAGYGTHMRCAEVVDTIFLKGHVVDPEQARPYRLVSNILSILLKNGPNKDRAIRLWQKVRPGNGGLVAKTKKKHLTP